MKLTKLFFVFLLCVTAGIGLFSCIPPKTLPPPPPPPPPPLSNDVYRNVGEYIHLIRENRINYSDLEYRLSRPFTADRQNKDNLNVGADNKALRIDEVNTRPNELSFSPNNESTFRNFSSTPRETFELFFYNNRILMRFERQNNHFVLVSVMLGDEPYIPRSGQIPYLEVKVKDNRSNQNSQSVPQNRVYQSSNDSILILNEGLLRRNDIDLIVDFISSRNRNIPYSHPTNWDLNSVKTLIRIYFDEAEREGINPDLAIAQMLYNTSFFSNNGIYNTRRVSFNYGANNPRTMPRTQYWNGSRYNSREIGVQAHIQFLKRLASGRLNDPRTPIVCPVWNEVSEAIAGTRQTWNEISIYWTRAASYRIGVENIYNQLHSYVLARRE